MNIVHCYISAYPWDDSVDMKDNLKIFLYLPSYVDPPDPYKLMGKSSHCMAGLDII